ncbi:hypothetical protein CH294_22875 [Rhodococcus sp. 14-2483-1-1]|uniref:hypothetical protein n=1 Tax=Rhodococcus sp. 14-2483-1-1 TaxID=2023148 RepID=UPI000B9A4580|nr:hypothetical protein [Rhodococcus sp. 14-2483-1-1]OZF31077.1 hypothetical protein CH294_22875 [Rhodococcus sp. 14-2483-1-1]
MTAVSPYEIDQKDDVVESVAKAYSRRDSDVVDSAVREYIDNHRDDIHQQVRAELEKLDGTRLARISLLTGLSAEEIEDLGGVVE